MSSYWIANRNRQSKYGNQKVELDGHKFDSKKEARRYAELKLMEKAGEIKDLELQKPYVIQPSFFDRNGKRQTAIKYIADFVYVNKGGETIIEDVKSPATRKDKVYRMKKKMMAYIGLEITEV